MEKSYSNQQLRDLLRQRMQDAGKPIERVQGGHAANQLYRIIAGKHAGKKVRLRTNQKYAVMALADDTEPSAAIPSLQEVDFVAIACINHSGEVECYVVPATRIVADMKAAHRAFTERLGRASGSKVRILKFRERADRPWYGYAGKYSEYRLAQSGNAPISRPQSPRRGAYVIERAKRMVADEFGVPPNAVRISFDFDERSGSVG